MPLRMRLALLFALATAVALTVAGLAFVAAAAGERGRLAGPGAARPAGRRRRRPGRAATRSRAGPGTLVQVVAADGRVLSSSAPAPPRC